MSAFQQIPNLPPGIALTGLEMFWAIQQGADVRITSEQLLAFIQSLIPLSGGSVNSYPSRVVTANAGAAMLSSDVALLINKSIAGATSVPLIAPTLGRLAIIKDMKGDAGTNNITIDAGSGKLINGLQTIVMNANYGTTMLIGMSATQWGTII